MKITTSNTFIYINERSNKKQTLENFKLALKETGLNHEQLNIIHVVGTNGKGSTVNYLASILRTTFKRVGTFTSPAITSFNERIRINDVEITTEDVNVILNKYLNLIEKYNLGTFEIYTLICIDYMMENKVDWLILEAGIGGRLDTTNAFDGKYAILTNVSLDHTQLLGDTVEKIAVDKLGIQKQNTKLIIGNSNYMDVITKNIRYPEHAVFAGVANEANYQTKNINTATKAAEVIGITPENIKEGIRLAPQWFGRLEQFGNIIIDGAHNIDGIKALLKSIDNVDGILFSAIKTKDVISMVEELRSFAPTYITKFDFGGKEIDSKEVAKNTNTQYISDWKEFIKNFDGKLLITGSLYFISDVRKYLLKTNTK